MSIQEKFDIGIILFIGVALIAFIVYMVSLN